MIVEMLTVGMREGIAVQLTIFCMGVGGFCLVWGDYVLGRFCPGRGGGEAIII